MIRPTIVSVLISIIATGCSIRPIEKVLVESENLGGKSGISLIDVNAPNNEGYSIKVTRKPNGGRDFTWTMETDIEQESPCKVKYHNLYYSISHHVVVEGRIGNGRKYPVILDTGGSTPATLVHDIHIVKNKLSICPFGTNKESFFGGFCYLPKLQIGNIALINFPALYQQRHVEVRVFGVPVGRDESIIIGLPVLKQFKYISFDNVNKLAEFSLHDVFECNDSNGWDQYPFSIEEDSESNAELFVKVPIAGKDMELKLDTGAGNGLVVREDLWKEIGKRIQNVNLKNDTALYPFYGRMACKSGFISKLEVGDNIVENVKVSVFSNDSKLLLGGNRKGLLGMQFFKNSMMVLDFEHKLMWVKE